MTSGDSSYDVVLVKVPSALIKQSARELAAFCHLIGTVTFLGFPVFVALSIWLSKRRTAPFVAKHAKESLNFQLNIVLGAVLAVVTRPYLESWLPQSGGYWLLGLAVLFLYGACLSLYAGRVASKGNYFFYPGILRVVR
jgi:hypothetical protein